jgi:4-cresol dehydrogenase (hydroxylating)
MITRREILGSSIAVPAAGLVSLSAAAAPAAATAAAGSRILPPGVSAAEFDQALREFETAVGKDWVLSSEEDVHPYRDYFSLLKDQPDELRPSAAVCPASVEEVQAVVRIANRHRIPLYAISTGKNFAYGGPAPNVRGSVTVDLKRMNRILEVDERRHTALVEPGVSYMDFYRYLQEHDLKVWVDTADVGWGGLMGNALERGMGYTLGPYRDHFSAHCGMEVVLPNGELMRTGMGALPGSKAWQDYKPGFGPDPSGLFAQGNFGIVVKMGFRLMPRPEHWRTGLITVPKRRDFLPLVDTVNYLTDLFVIGEPLYSSPLNRLLGDAAFHKAALEFDEASMDRIAAANNLHSWQVELQFYGSEKTTLANWEWAKELIQRAVPEANCFDGESLRVPVSQEQIEASTRPYPAPYVSVMRRNVMHGVPKLYMWRQPGRTDADPDTWNETHIGLFSVISRSGEAVLQAQKDFADIARKARAGTEYISALLTPLNWHQSCFLIGNSFFGTTTRNDNSPEGKVRQLQELRRILHLNAQAGYGDYRAPPILQDAVADQYSFNNHILRRFNETLKDAVDPNGILSPGRGGIWPKPHRKLRGGPRK